MAKTRITAQEIQQKVNALLAQCNQLDGDCRECRVSLPRQVPSGEPAQHYGGNWNIDTFQGPPPCHAAVQGIVAKVRQEYDCSDW